MSRAFSIAPKLLQASAEEKLDMILKCTFETLNCTRAEYLRWVENFVRQEARDEWEAVKQTSDRELRMERMKFYMDLPEPWRDIKVWDEKELESMFDTTYEERASSEAKWQMYNAGKEYDAQMARKKSKSNMTQAEIANAIDGEEARRQYIRSPPDEWKW